MYMEGDALDLFSWMTAERSLLCWDDLVKVLQDHCGPPEYHNPDEYLCNIKQTGTMHKYRQEWARRVARVKNWPDHCLLGVFMNDLKEELKTNVRIHKPRSVFRVTSLALEFEGKVLTSCGPKPGSTCTQSRISLPYSQSHLARAYCGNIGPSTYPTLASSSSSALMATPSSAATIDFERQRRREYGLCFCCGDYFRPGHRCNSTFSLMEIDDDDNPISKTLEPVEEAEEETYKGATISFNAIIGNPTVATMKLQGKL